MRGNICATVLQLVPSTPGLFFYVFHLRGTLQVNACFFELQEGNIQIEHTNKTTQRTQNDNTSAFAKVRAACTVVLFVGTLGPGISDSGGTAAKGCKRGKYITSQWKRPSKSKHKKHRMTAPVHFRR